MKKLTIVTINIKSFSHNILKYYVAAFFSLNKLKRISFKTQPTKHKTLTILKSPHKYKKAQEHYQLKIYKSSLVVYDVNIDELLFLLTNKPQGVFISVKLRQVINK
jgi:ribosomal protein S10